MTKRSFFKSISSLVAAVAIAPEIAFGTRLKMPLAEPRKEELWWLWTEGKNEWVTTEEFVSRWANTTHLSRAELGTLWEKAESRKSCPPAPSCSHA